MLKEKQILTADEEKELPDRIRQEVEKAINKTTHKQECEIYVAAFGMILKDKMGNSATLEKMQGVFYYYLLQAIMHLEKDGSLKK